jgi:ribonuclease Y
VEDIKSKKREYGESSTLCSKTACLNIKNLIDASTMASIDKEEAKEALLQTITKESEEDITSRILKLARDGEAKLEERARDILVNAIYRIGNSHVSQFTTATVEIEDEEMKGKIIGKEGRNIKTFERMSGVELLVDEVPNAIVVSCFDPVRRAIAKNALEMLVKDGRIQPAKIEEFLEKAKKEIGTFMRKKGEEKERKKKRFIK